MQGAIQDFDQASTLDPLALKGNCNAAEAYANHGFIRTNEFDLDGAIANFDRAITLDPKDANFFLKRGQAHLIKGNLAIAASDFDRCLTLKTHPGLAALAYADRGYVRLLQGNRQEAEKDFEQSIKANKQGKLFLDYHLKALETRIQEMKRRQALDQKAVI